MNRLLVALALASALQPLGSTAIAVAMPEIAQALHRPQAAVSQWLVTSYLLVGIVFQGPGGSFADRLGARATLQLGQACVAVGAVFAFFGNELWSLVLARVLPAAGGALIAPSSVALMRASLPVEKHGRAFAVLGMTMGLAAGLGPPLSGELVVRFGWRAALLLGVPLLLFSIFLGAGGTEEVEKPKTVRGFDVLGSVLLGVALVSLVASARLQSLKALLLSVSFFGLFAWWERRAAAPIVALELLGRRAFIAGGLVVAFQNLAMYALLFELPKFFSRARGVSPERTGRALMMLTLTSVFFAPIGARLAERIGPRAVCVAGAALGLGGVLYVREPTRLHEPSDAILGLMCIGAALGMTMAPSQTSALSAVEQERSGMGSGVLSMLRYMGAVGGLAVLGSVSNIETPAVVLEQHRSVMNVFAASMLLALLVAMALPDRLVPGAARK